MQLPVALRTFVLFLCHVLAYLRHPEQRDDSGAGRFTVQRMHSTCAEGCFVVSSAVEAPG